MITRLLLVASCARAVLLASLENICEFEYISLFYPIRMHNAYSVIDLHNDITKITSKAIEIGEKTNGKATFVVFIDELDTTSIMGHCNLYFVIVCMMVNHYLIIFFGFVL